MKKIFTAPSVNFMEVEMESAILGGSVIASGNATQGTQSPGTVGGDGLARHNGGAAGNAISVNADISAYELN